VAKAKWGIKGSEVDAAEESAEFEEYEGPDLKAGIYPVVLEDLKKTTFSSGNEGFFMRLKVDAPKGHPKEAYNGAPIWERIAVIDSQLWKLKPFLLALGGKGTDMDNTMLGEPVGDEAGSAPVTRLGRIGNPIGKKLRVSVKIERGEYTGPKVDRFMPPRDEEEAPEETTKAKAKKKDKPIADVDQILPPAEEKPAKASKKGKKSKDANGEPPF
jgi:hypothetical protein